MIAAILFGFVAVGLPFLFGPIRQWALLRGATLLVLLVHQVASALHVALHGLPTMKLDPFAFHSFALLGYGRLQHDPYAQFLHLLYNTFGASHFLGCQVSNIFFSLAILIFVKIVYDLGCERIAPALVLAFGLPLSCIFNTSVTLREAAQMAFFLALTYVLLDLCRRGVSYLTLSILPICWALHLLHNGLSAALLVILPLSLAWALKARPAILGVLLVVSVSGGSLVFERVLERLTEESAALENIVEGNLDYVEGYAANVGESRTDFGVKLDLSSLGALLKTGPLLYSYYLYSPLPWQVRGAMDLYGVLESLLRIVLTLYALKAIKNSRGRERAELILLAFIFFSMEAIWAAGTANWGTAFRHRLVAWGLLVAMGGKGIVQAKLSPPLSSTEPGPKQLSLRARRRALRDRRKERRRTTRR